MSTNDSVVVAAVDYTYTPLVFDYFLNRTLSSGTGGPGTYTLSEKIFMKPRGQAAMLTSRTASPVRRKPSEAVIGGYAYPPAAELEVAIAVQVVFHLCWHLFRCRE